MNIELTFLEMKYIMLHLVGSPEPAFLSAMKKIHEELCKNDKFESKDDEVQMLAQEL